MRRRTFYIFISLTAFLFIVSNIEMVARTTERLAKEVFTTTGNEEISRPEITSTAAPANELLPTDMQQQQINNASISVDTVIDKIKVVKEVKDNDSDIYDMVEQMPEYPGGMQALMNYLSTNIKYPTDAVEKNIQGRVIVQFNVMNDGSIDGAKIVRGIYPSLDKEALRVISMMPLWKPGHQDGKAVNVKFTIPVSFKTGIETQQGANETIIVTPDTDTKAVVDTDNSDPNSDKVYDMSDQMPEYPGGMQALLNYLSTHIKYPTDASKNKIQGRVVVQFNVMKDGSVEGVRVARGIYPSLDAEAVRVISKMPLWKPGHQNGKAVNVRFVMPVNFSLGL